MHSQGKIICGCRNGTLNLRSWVDDMNLYAWGGGYIEGGCIAQRSRSHFSPSGPGFESLLCRSFFSCLLLSSWTVEIENWTHQVIMTRISQCSAAKAWAKVLQKTLTLLLQQQIPQLFKNLVSLMSKCLLGSVPGIAQQDQQGQQGQQYQRVKQQFRFLFPN